MKLYKLGTYDTTQGFLQDPTTITIVDRKKLGLTTKVTNRFVWSNVVIHELLSKFENYTETSYILSRVTKTKFNIETKQLDIYTEKYVEDFCIHLVSYMRHHSLLI